MGNSKYKITKYACYMTGFTRIRILKIVVLITEFGIFIFTIEKHILFTTVYDEKAIEYFKSNGIGVTGVI